MRKFTLSAAVGAVLVASLVRVQLVAVAQDAAPGDGEVAAQGTDDALAPSGPPTKVPREELTYDGKRFADYEAILASELAPDRRAEAITAMTAFAPAGYGKEVADVIFAEMGSFDERRFADERGKNLRNACRNGLREIDPAIVMPMLIEAISPTDAEHVGPVAAIPNDKLVARRLALQSITSSNKSDELVKNLVEIVKYEHAPTVDRAAALEALLKLTDRFQGHREMVRSLVQNEDAPTALCSIALRSIATTSSDSEKFLNHYAQEFAAPVLLESLRRQEVRLGELNRDVRALLRRDPNDSVPFLVKWAFVREGSPDSSTVRFFYDELFWAREQFTETFNGLVTDDKVRALRVARLVVEETFSRSHPQSEEVLEERFNEAIVEKMASVLNGEDSRVADEAMHDLAILALDPRCEAARRALIEQGFEIDNEFRAKWNLRRNKERTGEFDP